MGFCINCGAKNVDGARFCLKCGKPVALPEQSSVPQANVTPAPTPAPVPTPKPTPAPVSAPTGAARRFCIKCGAIITDGYSFCIKCGTPASPVAQKPAEPRQAVPQPVIIQEPVVPEPIVPESVAPGFEPQQPASKNAFCVNCGTKIEPGFAFCMRCGTPLDVNDAPTETEILEEPYSGEIQSFDEPEFAQDTFSGATEVLEEPFAAENASNFEETNGYYDNDIQFLPDFDPSLDVESSEKSNVFEPYAENEPTFYPEQEYSDFAAVQEEAPISIAADPYDTEQLGNIYDSEMFEAPYATELLSENTVPYGSASEQGAYGNVNTSYIAGNDIGTYPSDYPTQPLVNRESSASPVVPTPAPAAPVTFNTNVNNNEPVNPVGPVIESLPKKPKKKVGKAIAITLVLLILLTVLGGAGYIAIRTFTSPVVKLASAWKNMATSGNTYNVSYTHKSDQNVTEKYEFNTKLDLKNKFIAVDNFKASQTDEKGIATVLDLRGYIDAGKKESGVYCKYKYRGMDTEQELTYFNGISTVVAEDQAYYYLTFTDSEFNEVMDTIGKCMALTDGEALSLETVNEIYEGIYKFLIPACDFSPRPDSVKLTDAVSESTLKMMALKLAVKFTDTKWLEDNFGYMKSKNGAETEYTFKVTYKSLDALCDAIEDELDDAFSQTFTYLEKNIPELYSELINFIPTDEDDDEIEISDIVDYYVDKKIKSMKDDSESYTLKYTIENKTITGIELKVSEGRTTETYTVKIKETSGISVTASRFNRYYNEGKQQTANGRNFVTRIKDQKCSLNMSLIIDYIKLYYINTGTTPNTLNELAAEYNELQKAVYCPWSRTPYSVTVNQNDGTVKVTCNDPKCAYNGESVTREYK